MADFSKRSIDPASIKMIEKAAIDKANTAFDRADEMKPCPIGSEGSCPKIVVWAPVGFLLRRKKERQMRRERKGEVFAGRRQKL